MKTCPFCCADLESSIAARWRIWLPLEPPSQNRVKGNVKAFRARREYQRFRDSYILLAKNQVQLHAIPIAQKRRRIVFTRVYSGRSHERDRGNLVGGMKPLLDALHHPNVGIIVDDSPEWLEDHYRQHKSSESGVWLDIEEFA